jgi:hypothetical protein
MSEAEYMEDGADYLEEGCQRQTCDGCMAYNYCLISFLRKDDAVMETVIGKDLWACFRVDFEPENM